MLPRPVHSRFAGDVQATLVLRALAGPVTVTVLHVTRAFSAQPTLGGCLSGMDVVEVPLLEALSPARESPEVIWDSSATAVDVASLRRRYPLARILATPPRAATEPDVVRLIAVADLVLRDEGVMLAAAGVQALHRRAGQGLGPLPREMARAGAQHDHRRAADQPRGDHCEVEPGESVASCADGVRVGDGAGRMPQR